MKWYIEDWMGKRCDLLGNTEFDSYEEARDEIMQFANSIADDAVKNGKYELNSKEYEECVDGICEDLYAMPKFDLDDMAVSTVKTADEASQQAIDWQAWQAKQSLSYGEIEAWADYFAKLGKKFNLLDEFKENGVI